MIQPQFNRHKIVPVRKEMKGMSGYIRGTIGVLAFFGLMGCGNGRLIDLVLGTGFALGLWICAPGPGSGRYST